MLVDSITEELSSMVDSDPLESAGKKPKKFPNQTGISARKVKKISTQYWNEIEDRDRDKVFSYCEELVKTGGNEQIYIAFDWAFRVRKSYEHKDFNRFTLWMDKYVVDGHACDALCTHALGEFLVQFPEFLEKTLKWSTSNNRWMRRASAVALIYPIKRGLYLENIFTVAHRLLLDGDDIVQKGMGMALNVAGMRYPKEVFQFVLKYKETMPKVAMTYATRAMPENWRKELLIKK
jgi:3-methyladenine DNA glycosylase AlkD